MTRGENKAEVGRGERSPNTKLLIQVGRGEEKKDK